MVLLLPLTTEFTTLFFWILALGNRSLFPICHGIAKAERLRFAAHKKKIINNVQRPCVWPLNLYSCTKKALVDNFPPKGSRCCHLALERDQNGTAVIHRGCRLVLSTWF